MDGPNNNTCVPADVWMSSHLDPQFPGSHGVGTSANPLIGDNTQAMSMTSAGHLDLSRKQTPLYSTYDNLPSTHYKQTMQAMTTSVTQPFATTPSSRSAWEFATENFSPTPKDLSTQSYSQPSSSVTPRYSQSVSASSRYPQSINNMEPQNISQPGRSFTSQAMPQSMREFPIGGASSSHTGVDSIKNLPQSVRELTSPNMTQQPTTNTADRSVWDLYSVNPSLNSYNMMGHASPTSNFAQDKAYAYNISQHSQGTAALNHSGMPSQKPPLVLGVMNSSGQAPTSYIHNRGSLPSDSTPMSTFAPSLYSNVAGATSAPKQTPSIDFDEQLGGYSPVSPPTNDSSPFSALSANHTTDPKTDTFMVSSFSNTVSSFSGGSSASTLSVRQNLHSDMLPMDLNVPLDMTKGWSPPDTVTSVTITSPSRPVTQSQPITSFPFQDVVKPSQAPTPISEVPPPSSNQSSNFSQKVPKKSNFYGRDASYFSVPEESPQPNHTSGTGAIDGDINRDSGGQKDVTSGTTVGPTDTLAPMSATVMMGTDLSSNHESNIADETALPVPNLVVHSTASSVSVITAVAGETREVSAQDNNNDNDSDEENIVLSQVRAELKLKHGDNIMSQECSDTNNEQTGVIDNALGDIPGENDDFEKFDLPLSYVPLVPPSVVVLNSRGKAPKGRRKRGVGVVLCLDITKL